MLIPITFVIITVMTRWCYGDINEYRLLRHLMSGYDASARPVSNSTHPLRVIFGMSLHLIIDVDERNQILTTNCWLTQKWNDSHLTWNSADYGGVSVVRIPYQRVWRPDIILYNNADAQYSTSMINTNVIVSNAGEVVWLSHGIFRSSCDIDVEFFPFDLQSCQMKWASWTYDGYHIDLVKQMEVGDVTNYQTNGEFDLVDFEAIYHEEYYSCCSEPYPDITYVIKMKRRPLFYVFNLILPCLLINGIALLVFYVPSESGEKVTLGISALLSMTVFLMTIRESLPPTEKTPLISLYYGVSICLVSFASGLSVVTLNLHHRGLRGTEVPRFLRQIILDGLGRLVFLRFDALNLRSKDPSSSGASTTMSATPKATDMRCTCNKIPSNRNYHHKSCSSISASRASAWFQSSNGSPKLNASAIPSERLRLHISEVENSSGIFLDPANSEKFQTSELDFLGLGPPSPKFLVRTPHTEPAMASTSNDIINANDQRLCQLLQRVSTAIEKNETRLEEQERREAIQLEWKQIALVCDRVLLLIFVITTAVATCVVLTSSPYGP